MTAPESAGAARLLEPDLSVVVLAVGAPEDLKGAIASLKRQTVSVEIVVVNSGGGDAAALVHAIAPEAKVVSAMERLWPGAARNRGIEASRAPWIAFMASDHIVSDTWAERRLAHHRDGHGAVACAVINSHPRNPFAWTSHLAILVGRLPGVPVADAQLYGVSYSRGLFERYGMFREDLRIGEDTEFNRRLAPNEQPVWAPDVQTVHRNPTTLRALLKDQYARGRRSGLHWPLRRRRGLIRRSLWRFRSIASLAFRSVGWPEVAMVAACMPLLLLAVFVHEFGVRAGRIERRAAAERDS